VTTWLDDFACLGLRFREAGMLEIVFDGPNLHAVTKEMHTALSKVWAEIERDPSVEVIVVRGADNVFSAGGSFDLVEHAIGDWQGRMDLMHETRDLVYAIVRCSKPIVSAIEGPAVGAALVVALLADISVAGRSARLIDGHTRLGLAAGDHSVLCWPLLCGMAKAKYYLLTCDRMSGEEAERIGLVSLCVDDGAAEERAVEIARKLQQGATSAIRLTKQTLNGWYEAHGSLFDASVLAEFHGFGGPEVIEGLASHREHRPPSFPR
jgi:enoyl-CoA hydratase